MGKDLFEIFLGTFNAEPWIEQVISSLEAQDHPAFKVRIFDNASTDNTVEALSKILSSSNLKNDYVLYTNEKNVGPISTFLNNLDKFHSDWIIMIHQDDHYHSNHISTLNSTITEVTENVGIVFSAMERIDGEDNERISPPTLSSKLSKTDRLENFMLSLQISPINFPACAIRTSEINRANTSRHTTAFNDIEMLLQIMARSEVRYVPQETMHYRIYPGNASSTTSTLANDRAVLVGLVELFHSDDIDQVLQLAITGEHWVKLIRSINQAIEIRIESKEIRLIARNLLAESLVRKYGYSNIDLVEFLKNSLLDFGLISEAEIASNNHVAEIGQKQRTFRKMQDHNYGKQVSSATNVRRSFINTAIVFVPLRLREYLLDRIFLSFVFSWSSRPFIRVWRLRGR